VSRGGTPLRRLDSDRLNDPLRRYPLSAARIVHRYTAASEALPCNVHNPGLRLIKRYAELFEDLYRSGRGVLRLGPIPAGHYLVPPIACAGTRGFEFLGFKIQKNLYAIPTQKSVDRKDQIRTLTQRLKQGSKAIPLVHLSPNWTVLKTW
jgi:hypothetical protein